MSSLRFGVLTLVLFPAAIAALGKGGANESDSELSTLAWLEGHWYGTINGGHWETSYTSPEGGVILSASKELKNGSVAMIEFEHFFTRDGKVILAPYPHGRKSKTEFEMIQADRETRRAVFAADNDFPGRIVYHRIADDRLLIDLFPRDAAESDQATVRIDLKRRD